MNLSYRIYHVFVRNLISYKRFVLTTFLVSLVQPLFYLITFGVGMGAYMGAFGGKPYLYFLVPGVLISSVMMSATFECLYGTFVKIVHEHLYDSLIATPVSAEDAVAGDIALASFRGLVSGCLMLAVAGVMGILPVSVLAVVVLILVMLAVGIMFGSLGMIITSKAPNFDFFNYYTELVITPMLFFSGVFFPLDHFPGGVLGRGPAFAPPQRRGRGRARDDLLRGRHPDDEEKADQIGLRAGPPWFRIPSRSSASPASGSAIRAKAPTARPPSAAWTSRSGPAKSWPFSAKAGPGRRRSST
jgi:lipooligosaccharide transport system permease protein